MKNDPKFEVHLKEAAAERLNRSCRFVQQAGGCDDLWMELNGEGIEYDDVSLIEVQGLSDQDKAVNDAVRALEKAGQIDIYLGVCVSSDVYLIASVMHGGLIEFQVSDGPINSRGTSFDCYDVTEAKRLFDEVVEKGWKRAGRD